MSSEEITREIAGARPQLGRLNIVRRAVLDLDGLDDMESAKVLVLAILSKMRALQWPQETSPESLLFAIVNEAVHTLEKTAADFLLTEDSPADSLKS